MIFYLFLTFLFFGVLYTFLHIWGYKYPIFLYFLGLFQILFILYRFRPRVEIADFEVIFPFFILILIFILFKVFFYFFVFTKKKDNVFSRFFITFVDLSFTESVVIIHKFLTQYVVYDRTIRLFFCKYLVLFLRLFPFTACFIFLFISSFFVNVSLFLEVFLTGKLYLTLYFFVLSFCFRFFYSLLFYFSRYYLEQGLKIKEEEFFNNFSFIDSKFLLNSLDLKKEDFIKFGSLAVSAEQAYQEYQEMLRCSRYSFGFKNILGDIRSFVFDIFTMNLFICCLWSLSQFYEVSIFFQLFFLISIPFFLYFGTLCLSTYKDRVINFLITFYRGNKKIEARVYWALSFIVGFFLFFLFLILQGLSYFSFIILFCMIVYCFLYFFEPLKKLIWFICFRLNRIGCIFGGAWYQKLLIRYGIYMVDDILLDNDKPLAYFQRYFCWYPFSFSLFFVFLELSFFGRFQYSAILLLSAFFVSFIGLFLMYISLNYTFEQEQNHSVIIQENCDYNFSQLKEALIKPEDFIGHTVFLEAVWLSYREMHYYHKNNVFVKAILHQGFLAYLVFVYKFAIFLFLIYIISILFLFLHFYLCLFAFYLIILAYWTWIRDKLIFSSYWNVYNLNILNNQEYFEKIRVWFNEQSPRAEGVFNFFIKAKQQEK